MALQKKEKIINFEASPTLQKKYQRFIDSLVVRGRLRSLAVFAVASRSRSLAVFAVARGFASMNHHCVPKIAFLGTEKRYVKEYDEEYEKEC